MPESLVEFNFKPRQNSVQTAMRGWCKMIKRRTFGNPASSKVFNPDDSCTTNGSAIRDLLRRRKLQ